MTAHAQRHTVRGWRAALAILPFHWSSGGRHSQGQQEVPEHEGATPAYGDELRAMNEARRASRSRTFRRGPQPKPGRHREPRTQYVSTDATAATEARFHRDELDSKPMVRLPRKRPEPLPLTGEFTQCEGCGHLGCLGDCTPVSRASARARTLNEVFAGVNRARDQRDFADDIAAQIAGIPPRGHRATEPPISPL